jgi:glycosyltransferase involved in cell wall biosynthesis
VGTVSSGSVVSVVLICFNAEEFIREAIESVLAQTYSNWELLLVDDGSTDASLAVAQWYARKYPERVRYLEHAGHQNRGMSASRNVGIANARGEFIAFVDADDVWLPHKLERQVAELESRSEAGMTYGPTQWWYSWTGSSKDVQRDYIHDLGVQSNALLRPPALLLRFLRDEAISPCTCSALLRRKTVERVGGFEEIFRGMYEDQAFFAKVCLSVPVFVSAACSARYRQHARSNCYLSKAIAEYNVARSAFLSWLSEYLATQNINDIEVWEALRCEMWPYRHRILHRIYHTARQKIPGRIFRLAHTFRGRWLALPLIRQLRCVQFRSLRPVGNGRIRGMPIVRYHWEKFLQRHEADIRGVALEVGTTRTLRRFGAQATRRADAIDLSAHSPEVTIVADLARADHVPSEEYDCFVNQFTMHMIYDVDAALYHSIRMLKPGGVLLINFSCVDYYFSDGLDMHTGAPLFMYWWFTPMQVENLLRRTGLSSKDFEIEVVGNLFSRVAYQMSIPAEELTEQELDYVDPGHPLLICARIVKPTSWKASKPEYRDAWVPDRRPAEWNHETGHYPASERK